MIAGNDDAPIVLQRDAEQLRQERETFEQRKQQEHWWFILRLSMGFTSIFMLAGILGIATYILLNHQSFPESVVTASGAALFVDVLGLLVGVWKVALNPDPATRLHPVTRALEP